MQQIEDEEPSAGRPRGAHHLPRGNGVGGGTRAGGIPALLTGLLALAIGAPLWLAVHTGSIHIPHNDAWAYSAISQTFARTGHFHLLGWNRGALIGQVVLIGPLGKWLAAQQLAMVVLGVAAAVMTYRLASAHAGRAAGVLAAALVMFFPGYALLSTSFMEDIPAYFATVACLLLGERALRTQSTLAFVAALLVGVWGCTVREQVVAAPLAVVVAVAWRDRRSRAGLVKVAVALLGFLILFALFEAWRNKLPHADQATLTYAGTTSIMVKSFRAYYTLALLVSPAVLAQFRIRMFSRLQWGICALVGLIECAIFAHYQHARGFLGGSLIGVGPYSAEHNGVRMVLPSSLIDVLEVVALVAGALLPVLIYQGWKRLGPILSIFGVLVLGGTLFEIGVNQSVFDRYLLALVPLVVIACGPIEAVNARMRAIVGAAVLGCVSLALAGSALTVDAAEWHAGQSVVRAGVAATDVDAGFDWVGYHAATPADQHRLTTHPTQPYYLTLFPRSRDCVAVSVAPPSSGQVLRTVGYRTYGIVGTSHVYVTDTGKCALSAAVKAKIASGH